MLLTSLEQLDEVEERALIINCGTKALSTLALFSALRYAGMPILLVDCESQDGSREHFCRLADQYEFDLLSAPLRGHGITLDGLLPNMHARKVLLIDSDLEILGDWIIRFMKDHIDDERVFGCGFIHGPLWMDAPSLEGTLFAGAYYQERPWIPLTLLKTAPIHEAITQGYSFKGHFLYNDCVFSERLSKRIAEFRIRHPLFKGFKLPGLFRNTFNGARPSLVYYDTGADIYHHLKHGKGLEFVGLPARLHQRYCTHMDGATRQRLLGGDRSSASCDTYVRERLLNAYGYRLG